MWRFFKTLDFYTAMAIITAVALTNEVLAPRSKRIRKIEKRFGKPMEEVLRQLYWVEGLTQAEVAKKVGAPPGTVAGWLIRFGVNRRAVETAIEAKELLA